MRHAFTVIELVIVVMIIAIIACIAVPRLIAEREAAVAKGGPSRVVHRYYSETHMIWRIVLREGDGRTADLPVSYDDYIRAEIGKPWPLVPEVEAK